MIQPENANDQDYRRVARVQAQLLEEYGAREIMNLRPFDPRYGAQQTRKVNVKLIGYYELYHGEQLVTPKERYEKEHVFEMVNFQSYDELVAGVRDAFHEFENMVAYLDNDSGYKVFYPCIWIATDSLADIERQGHVRRPTQVRLHASLPIQYAFLKRMGVDVKRIQKQNDYENCYAGALVEHCKKHGIMKMKQRRGELTEEAIAKASLPKEAHKNWSKHGISIEDGATWIVNDASDFNVYAWSQEGNLLWCSEHKNTHYAAFHFVAHDAHCYVITDPTVRRRLEHSYRASKNPNKSALFAQNKADDKREKMANDVVELLKRPRIPVEWDDSEPIDRLIAKLSKLENCNVFLPMPDLYNVLIKLFQKEHYVHTGTWRKTAFARIDYFDDVTIWANPNSTVSKPDINLFGSSAMSRDVCSRLGIPFKNQSVGAATKEFYEDFYHPLGDRASVISRKSRPPAERKRLGELFKWTCGMCQSKISQSEGFEIDHKVRWEISHDDSDANLQLLHKMCHDAKSRAEGGERLFKKDRTMSHFNRETLKVFGHEAKNAMIHNFIPYREYAYLKEEYRGEQLRNRDGTVRKKLKLVLKDGVFIAGLDLVKCRTNELKYGITDSFPDYSFLDDPCKFNIRNPRHMDIPAGEYWISVTKGHKTRLAKGNGWYTHIEVKYLLETKWIRPFDIKYMIKATMTHPGNYYQDFVQAVLDKVIKSKPGTRNWEAEVFVAKSCINQWVGTLGIRSHDFKKVELYSSLDAAASESSHRVAGQGTSEQTKRNTSVPSDGRKVTLFPRVFNSRDMANYDQKGALRRHDYVEVVETNSKIKQESYAPVFRTILGAECVDLWRTMDILERFGGRIAHVNTDNAVALFDSPEQIEAMWAYASKITWDAEGKVPKYKRSDMPSPNCVTRMEKFNKEQYEWKPPSWNIIKDPGHNDFGKVAKKIVDHIEKADGLHRRMIEALAGCGKTTLTNAIIAELKKRDIEYLCIAPTHVASNQMGAEEEEGKTIDSSLNSIKHGNFAALSKIKVVILDEMSMARELHLNALYSWTQANPALSCIMVGNWVQWKPVMDRADFDYENATAIHEMCGGNLMQLEKCRRAKDDAGGRALFKTYQHIRKTHKIDRSKFGTKEVDRALCFYNTTVWKLNKFWMNKYKPKHHMVVKTSQRAHKIYKTQDIIVYDGLPVMACVTRNSFELKNGTTWIVKKWDEENITLKSDHNHKSYKETVIPKEDFAEWLRPAYAISSHKAQGQTYRRPFVIHDWDKMSWRGHYVCVSRGTTLDHVNISTKVHKRGSKSSDEETEPTQPSRHSKKANSPPKEQSRSTVRGRAGDRVAKKSSKKVSAAI